MVRPLTKLQELINEIKKDANIQRFQQLEKIIDQDENLKIQHSKLLNIQKKLVQSEYYKSANLETIKAEYETVYNTLIEHVLMSEYLDLLQSINDDLQLIERIITEEINMDFD